MSHIPIVGKKSLKVRLYLCFVFMMLIIMGTTMIVPFLITISGSMSNDYDYERYLPVPRYFWSSTDRFTKGLVNYFNYNRGWCDQMRAYYPTMPKHWASWSIIGQDINGTDAFADKYLKVDKATQKRFELMGRDYSEFSDQYSLADTQTVVKEIEAIEYLKDDYEFQWEQLYPEKAKKASRSELRRNALNLLSKTWELPFETFYNVKFTTELRYPMGFQGWSPSEGNPKYIDFLSLKKAYRDQVFTPGVKASWLAFLAEKNIRYKDEYEVFPVYEGTAQNVKELWPVFKGNVAPASPTIPFALRAIWYKFLTSENALRTAELPIETNFGIETYNKLAGTKYETIYHTPFPIPADFNQKMQALWVYFVNDYYPLRLTKISVTPELSATYHKFIEKELKSFKIANELLGQNYTSWNQYQLAASIPGGSDELSTNHRSLWINFVKKMPMNQRVITSSEIEFQKFLLAKYETIDNINATYNWKIRTIEEAFPPFAEAYAVTLKNNATAFMVSPVLANYNVILDFMLLNANAVPVTLLLIVMAVLCTLTINPIAAYALSRFNLKGKDKIILIMLATMAFPAMVSAIPAYLLMRDLGLLNTFFALVLPGAANGMAIFILKGFFDSLPMELFEAATIDGASEMQIFRIVAMPLVKPILAINSLGAFIAAYNGWQWALIICQDKKMWTIAVWLYQANMWWQHMPWLVSAGFVIASVPTFIVFISCQKIILRGIIIPSMK